MRGELLIINTSDRYRAICDELDKLGWNTTVHEPKPSSLIQWYTNLRSFRPSLRTWKKNRVRIANRLARTPWMFRYRSRACARDVRKQISLPDVVLQIGAWFSPGMMFAGAPYTVFCDCTTRLGEIDPFSGVHFSSAVAAKQWYAMEQSIYRNAAFVFPSSQFVHRSLIRDYEVPESRVLSVGSAPNLRAPECVDRDYSNRSIVFVGYEFERKGGLVLLEAFRKVVTVLPDAQLWIAGPPRLDYTLPPRACLLGSLEPEQLSEVYRHASLFVMPSLFEPFGIAFLEAMDHRLPCIGSDRCAIPEIISHGETGLVAPAGNSDALAGGIIYLLQRPELMRRMGAAGHAKVRKTFTWPAVARRIDEKLLEVCAHLRYSP